jgi:hypothetical protein
MLYRVLSKAAIGFIALMLWCTFCGAQATSSTLSVKPDSRMPFGDHDIGTATAQSLTATNDGDAPIDLMISISGESAGDFFLE